MSGKQTRAPSAEEKEIIESITGPAEPGMVEVATDLDEIEDPHWFPRDDFPSDLSRSEVKIEVNVNVTVEPGQKVKPARCRCGIFTTIQHDC